MDDVKFNSNEMCQYLLRTVIKLQAENVALREFFLATVKQTTPSTNIETLRQGMVDASIMIVPELLKGVPEIGDLQSNKLNDELTALFKSQ